MKNKPFILYINKAFADGHAPAHDGERAADAGVADGCTVVLPRVLRGCQLRLARRDAIPIHRLCISPVKSDVVVPLLLLQLPESNTGTRGDFFS